jgi:hypothetical protein
MKRVYQVRRITTVLARLEDGRVRQTLVEAGFPPA